jgi:hypothetical protein
MVKLVGVSPAGLFAQLLDDISLIMEVLGPLFVIALLLKQA